MSDNIYKKTGLSDKYPQEPSKINRARLESYQYPYRKERKTTCLTRELMNRKTLNLLTVLTEEKTRPHSTYIQDYSLQKYSAVQSP